MKATPRNLAILTAFFVVALVISNVIAGKVLQFGIIEIPAAVLAYPVTFLMIDVISEIWGKEEAKKTVALGFIVQLFSLLLIYLAIILPPAPYMAEFSQSFAETLSTSGRFVLASLAAYVVSQLVDVHLFHAIKARFKPKWMRNNSTVFSQLIDTTIFITIAFAGVVPNLLVMIVSQYVVKVLFAFADTLPFYLLTREPKEEAE